MAADGALGAGLTRASGSLQGMRSAAMCVHNFEQISNLLKYNRNRFVRHSWLANRESDLSQRASADRDQFDLPPPRQSRNVSSQSTKDRDLLPGAIPPMVRAAAST